MFKVTCGGGVGVGGRDGPCKTLRGLQKSGVWKITLLE